MTFIQGYTGPYGNQSAIARGLNAGLKVAQLSQQNPYALQNSNIQYTTLENGKLSINGGLAYSGASLMAMDQNRDGKVTTQEAGQLGKLLDLNNDGVVSAGENLAFTMYQDSCGNIDGVSTPEERQKALQQIMANPNKARQDLGRLYNGNGIGQREGARQPNSCQQTSMPQAYASASPYGATAGATSGIPQSYGSLNPMSSQQSPYSMMQQGQMNNPMQTMMQFFGQMLQSLGKIMQQFAQMLGSGSSLMNGQEQFTQMLGSGSSLMNGQQQYPYQSNSMQNNIF